jgi:hypothetical protein
MLQPILIRIHKKTRVPSKRRIKHDSRSDWKIKGKISYEDSQEIFFVLGGLIKTDAQFAKALFNDFGSGEYMCIYWKKGMKGFRNFINLICHKEGYFMQTKPSVYKSSNKPKGPFPYLESTKPRYKVHEYENYKSRIGNREVEVVEEGFWGPIEQDEEISQIENENIEDGQGFW